MPRFVMLEIGFQASLGMEDIGCLPKLLQRVHQIEDQGDIEFFVHSNLERALTVSQGEARR